MPIYFLVKFMKKPKFGANFDENQNFWVKWSNLERGMHLHALVMSDFSNNVLIFTVLIIKIQFLSKLAPKFGFYIKFTKKVNCH